ncbi:hypothetical protein TCAL_03830 [Tigriopus californicus]|uniref:Tyrosine specific protein phosphatases domain-containing protein n=1 Tax=Tigriopus californicus TaxID=6832 RepID=A0A553PGR3_TIGCA|nr:paladin-like [Tigriopus californicus]TRY76868.1 hypothetical protein TCAL_03830 [Tigriopus californicus]|eukprot:TCALIF_03830-PA protein Name:"Similar to pald1 Paladin (Danio rerio)" AED:0.04 eAED:0.04 QI:262/1/1/1/1/1/4/120/550
MPSIHACKAMTDHFDGIDRMVKEAPRIEGAPNFRRLPGFPVFGTGQTTVEGYAKCLEPIMKKYGDEKDVFWVNLRQEPVFYVNGKPYTPRDPERLNYHLEVMNPEDSEKMEVAFVKEVKTRGLDFKYYKDQYGEHPDERAVKNEEVVEKIESVLTLEDVIKQLKEKNPTIKTVRIPMNQEKAPAEECFDEIVSLLKNSSASTPILFNCQAGISRTTTGMIIAAIIKEFQLSSELDQMKGIVPDDILDALKKKKLGLPGFDADALTEKNAMLAGDFEVILELIAAEPQAKMAKAQVDKLVNMAAPPPKGTGVHNLREAIIEHKMTFDVASDDWQEFLKNKIMSNIERYFYLIVFSMYVREQGSQGFPVTFKQWMDERSNLRTMIAEGRSKLEWERKIPDDKLVNLKEMLDTSDFKTNLPKVIKRIYELAWQQFSDLPRGHHKNNSMHKLASKTMIEILPEKLINYIEERCGSLATTPDFFDVIGQVSWYQEDGSGILPMHRPAEAPQEAAAVASPAMDAPTLDPIADEAPAEAPAEGASSPASEETAAPAE